MSKSNTEEGTTVECTDEVLYKILTACQSSIFRDIWRLHDVDAALKMLNIMQHALPGNLDRSDTPNLNALSKLLRNEPDALRYLEFAIVQPHLSFGILRFQEQHNRRAAAIRAAEREAAERKGDAQQ